MCITKKYILLNRWKITDLHTVLGKPELEIEISDDHIKPAPSEAPTGDVVMSSSSMAMYSSQLLINKLAGRVEWKTEGTFAGLWIV